VPGNGTLNLSRLWRALGIKNPQTTISERVQLVIQVADFSRLVPEYRPATGSFGADVAPGGGGTFTRIEVTSRSPGGTIIRWFESGKNLRLITGAPDPALANVVIEAQSGTWSRDPLVSLVRTGQSVIAPPLTFVNLNAGVLTELDDVLWIPPGSTALFINGVPAQIINLWGLFLIDLPAADAPPD